MIYLLFKSLMREKAHDFGLSVIIVIVRLNILGPISMNLSDYSLKNTHSLL